MDPEQFERFEAKIRQTMRDDRPLKREGTPDDIGRGGLVFRHRPLALVTGTVLPVDGARLRAR
jgi:NAD(P)-dependent dehydrogenase (short-subunit alcohol dehydrogenase family)